MTAVSVNKLMSAVDKFKEKYYTPSQTTLYADMSYEIKEEVTSQCILSEVSITSLAQAGLLNQ